MTDAARDYSETLFLPKTDFPMRAGLPQKEPELLARWAKLRLYHRLREDARGRTKFVLHDGPPYANGNIHIGHALNKILKDVVTRSQQMLGHDSNYVPGWDCHGLPIEWKIEEENYRSKNKPKPNLSDPAAMIAFRKECRAYAEHWLKVQREEFKRLGVEGDWDHPYSTMDFAAEAQIAREIMKFAQNGTLYRGSKPVMWSVVEKTALAEAEVEYEDYTSDQVWVKFPVDQLTTDRRLTTAELTASTFDACECVSRHLDDDAMDASRQPRDQLLTEDRIRPVRGDRRAGGELDQGRRQADPGRKTRRRSVAAGACDRVQADRQTSAPTILAALDLRASAQGIQRRLRFRGAAARRRSRHRRHRHRLRAHRARPWPRGLRDVDRQRARSSQRAASTPSSPTPSMRTAPSPSRRRASPASACINDKGEKGDANEAVIKALSEAGMLIARARLKHQYPHSWRSKKPVIFRNTPQWFIAMDKPIADAAGTRSRATRCATARSKPSR